MKKLLRIFAVVWGSLMISQVAEAQLLSKLSGDLNQLLAQTGLTTTVIVQYNQTPGLLEKLEIGLLGGVIKQTLTSFPGQVVELPVANLLSLLGLNNVAYVTPDRPVLGLLDITAPAVNAPAAWKAGFDGSGIGVAVIDSGIADHPDLHGGKNNASRVVYHQNFIGGAQNDLYGHGTHVAGIIGGDGTASTGPGFTRTFTGIAPNVNLIDLRVLDQNGASTDTAVIAAIEQAIALKTKYNIKVINLSIGRPIFESYHMDPLCRAVEAAWNAGIVVVVAAGNLGRNGYATITSPGNDPEVITVGAMKNNGTVMRQDDQIASYSSRGPSYIDLVAKPDIVAPGNLEVSLLAPGSTLAKEFPANIIASSYYFTGAAKTPEYFRLSGTSMATPCVSAAAAILLQKSPSISPDTVKARLMKTASKNFPLYSTAVDPTTGKSYMDAYDLFTVGAGYLDIQAALASNDVVKGNAKSPTTLWLPALHQADLVFDSSAVWGSTAVWGSSAVWGSTTLVNGTSAVWGSTAVWGSSAVWGSTAVWGSSAVWGSTAVWGSSAVWGSTAVWGSNTGLGEN